MQSIRKKSAKLGWARAELKVENFLRYYFDHTDPVLDLNCSVYDTIPQIQNSGNELQGGA